MLKGKALVWFWFGVEVLCLVLAMVAFAWPLVAKQYDLPFVFKSAAVSATFLLLSLVAAYLWRQAARKLHTGPPTWQSLGVPETMVRERENLPDGFRFQDPPQDMVDRTIQECIDRAKEQLDKEEKDKK